jgi:hypothetical protein
MPWTNKVGYRLARDLVLSKAPTGPGVYAIYSASSWIYIGETDNVQLRLLEHLEDTKHCMHRYPGLHFSWENATNRPARVRQLQLELRTPCNQTWG